MTTLSQTDRDTFTLAWNAAAKSKTLTAADHLLYNLVHERAIHAGFTPISSVSKLTAGMPINHGLYLAYMALKSQLHFVANGKEYPAPHYATTMSSLPIEYIQVVELPKVEELTISWGAGKTVIPLAIDRHVKTFDELDTLIDQCN